MRLSDSTFAKLDALYQAAKRDRDLDCAVRKARKALDAVGCKLHRQGYLVSFISPDTGTHTLNLAPGVRPVSDLIVHCKGFVELQPHAKPLVRW